MTLAHLHPVIRRLLAMVAVILCSTSIPAVALDTVGVTVITPVASEDGSVLGVVRFSRTGSTGPVTINYTTSGTAVSGTNYTALPGAISFVQGETTKDLTVTPIHDNVITGRLVVSISITPNAAYTVGLQTTAQVTIADIDLTATVDIPAEVADEDPAIPSVTGDTDLLRRGVMRVLLSASGSSLPDRTVSLTFGGAGVNGTDYTLLVKICDDALSGIGSTGNGRPTTGIGYASYAFLRGSTSIEVAGGSGALANGSTVQFDGDGTIYTVTGLSGTSGFITVNPALVKSVANGTGMTVLTGIVGPATTPPTGFSVFRPDAVGAQTLLVDDNGSVGFVGGGGLYVGDVFTLPSDTNEYVITAVSGGINASTGHFGTITFRRFSSTGVTGGAGIGEQLTGSVALTTMLPVTASSGQNLLVPSESSRVEYSVAPKSTGQFELAKDVTMILQASTDYQIVTPTGGSVTLAQRDVLVSVALGGNAGKPSTAGSFVVTLSHAFTVPVTVPYTVIGGTATPGVDYIALTGSIDIPANQTTQTIAVTPLNTAPAGATTVRIALNSTLDYKLAGSGSSGTNPSATLNITDSLGAVGIATTVSAAVESPSPTPGIARVTIVRNAAGALTVNYAVSGSAVAGTRYTTLPGTVTIASGVNFADIVVTPIDDLVYEGSQSVVLSLVAGQGYAIDGTAASATINIADDEPLISIAAGTNAALPSTSGSFVVSYPGIPAGSALNRAVDVPLTYSGTAAAGSDFSAPSIVTIPAGSRSATVVVTPAASAVASTVTATIGSRTAYGLGTSSASITISQAQQVNQTKPDVGSVSTGKKGGCGRGSGMILATGLALYLSPLLRFRRRRADRR